MRLHTDGLVMISGMGCGPGVDGKSLFCRFPPLPNARSRPMSPPALGVLGVWGICGSFGFGVTRGAPQLPKSSGDGGTGDEGEGDIDGRCPRSEK